MRRFTGITFAAFLFASAASAKEPTPDEIERARTFFNAGAQAYSAAKYADAVRSFEHAYELAPRPQVLFSLAQAERKEGFASNNANLLRRAVQHYKEYLEQVPSGGRRAEATEAKADLEARLGRLDPGVGAAVDKGEKRKPRVTVYSATPNAKASIDGGPAEELPYFADLGPGKHKVRVFAEGYFDAEKEVSGDRGIDVPLDVPLKEKPAQVTITLDTSAEVYVDGRLVANTPLQQPVEVPAGVHVISVVKNGRKPFSQEVQLERGKPFVFAPKLETSGQRVVAFSLLGTGGLGLFIGAFYGLAAAGAENRVQRIDEERTRRPITTNELEDHNRDIDRRDDWRTAAIISTAVGGTLALGGLALFIFDKPNVAVLPPRSVEPGDKKKEMPIEVTGVRAFPLLGGDVMGAGFSAKF